MATTLPVIDNGLVALGGEVRRTNRSKKVSVLVATVDSRVRHVLSQLFDAAGVDVLWAAAIEEVRSALDHGKVAACFCGSWLVDGTYRNILHALRCRASEIPVVMVYEPECSQEFQDYLAAVNIRAIDFFSHPYERADFARIMKSISGLAEFDTDCTSTVFSVDDETVPAFRPVS